MIVFNAFFRMWLCDTAIFVSYLEINARVCATILGWLGESAGVTGVTVSSPTYSLEIRHGCDAIQPIAFYIFLMLVSPVACPMWRRIAPIIVVTTGLLVLNLVRIISLYYIGVFVPSAFDVMHMEVWQAAFIILPVAAWVSWVRRVCAATGSDRHVRAP